MKYIEVLCEGSSDVPTARQVLERRFKLEEGKGFRVHPHRGKGKLPSAQHLLKRPAVTDQTLLGQLPIKLKNMALQTRGAFEVVVVVLVDADDDDPTKLGNSLAAMYEALPTKPRHCLFCIAVEETESWFIAEPSAVKKAYQEANTQELARVASDSVCGAWETLARALGLDPRNCTGADKHAWATAIAPYLNLHRPVSPSLATFVSRVSGVLKT